MPSSRGSSQPKDQSRLLHWQADSLALSHGGSPLCLCKLQQMQWSQFCRKEGIIPILHKVGNGAKILVDINKMYHREWASQATQW